MSKSYVKKLHPKVTSINKVHKGYPKTCPTVMSKCDVKITYIQKWCTKVTTKSDAQKGCIKVKSKRISQRRSKVRAKIDLTDVKKGSSKSDVKKF